MTSLKVMIYFLVWITAIGLLVSTFFYNLAKLVLDRASKICFWDLKKLRMELRKSPSYIFTLENLNTNS